MISYVISCLLFVLVVGETNQIMTDVQAAMDNWSSITGYGFSFGYIDAQGLNFTLASGPRSNKFLKCIKTESNGAIDLDIKCDRKNPNSG